MKLFKFICGSDEKIGAFEDEQDAYDRRTEIDQTFFFLPVIIEEVTLPGYVITITPIDVGAANDQPVTAQLDPIKMTFDELKEWLDGKEIKYHSQIGEKKLRDLVIQKWAIAKEAGEL